MRFTSIAAAATAVLAGCFYSPGSYTATTSPFVGVHTTVGCLDLAIALSSDPMATRGPVVAYTFGNHCFHETVVDFSAITAFAPDANGVHHGMRPTDPYHELRPHQLDGLWRGDEQIEYVTADNFSADQICIDLARLDSSSPRDVAHVVCMGATL